MRRVVLLVLMSGCGRIAFDSVGAAGDAGNAGDAGAGGPLPVLDPFVQVAPIAELSSAFSDDDPTITLDGLDMIFASERSGASDIYETTRASLTDPWGPPTLVTVLSTTTAEKAPEFSADGLSLWFERNGDIAVATRPTRASPWSAAVIALNTAEILGTPATCDQNLRMILRITDGNDNDLLYTSTRASTAAAWSAPSLLTDFTQSGDHSGPWLASNCTRMYFDKDHALPTSTIMMTDRDAMTGTYGEPIRAFDPATGAVHDVSLTADERYAVFSKLVGSNEQLWEATR
jgi:hypothetical protein